MSTFQCKFNCVNLFSCSWDICRQSFYSYWWPDISVICCHFCASYTYTDALIWGFPVQLSLWKLVYWLWRYKLNKVCDTEILSQPHKFLFPQVFNQNPNATMLDSYLFFFSLLQYYKLLLLLVFSWLLTYFY